MTTLTARHPLQTLSMSSTQRGPRRLSARLQEKEETQPYTNGYHLQSHNPTPGHTINGTVSKRVHDKPPASKKRKIQYDEEDNGFMFTRAKARNSRPLKSTTSSIPEQPVAEKEKENSRPPEIPNPSPNNDKFEPKEPPKKRKNRLSFSTPISETEKPVRRSKRLSDEAQRRDDNPPRKTRRKEKESVEDSKEQEEVKRPLEEEKTPRPHQVDVNEEHSATQIALPFADTPIIRKNKAMREGKGAKGSRRSSLGLRGRRASSLIDSGNSNALPHSEVEVADFYKHIESEGLTEPRRMRQLLTWCATRAMGEPAEGAIGTHVRYEDKSAHLSARVIQEELLRDFANRSEMSDWFSREDVPKPEVPLPLRPNLKNIQNTTKIEELEAQIRRLKSERQSLEALLRPPSIPTLLPSTSHHNFHSPSHAHPPTMIDPSLLSASDTQIWDSLRSSTAPSLNTDITSRINSLTASLEPTIDAFADGIHKMARYQDAAERVAGAVLGVCAQRLEERDQVGSRRREREGGESPGGQEDLKGVLRCFGRLDR